MSARTIGAICALAFLLLMSVTLTFPAFPPAQMLYEFLEFPQNSMSIFGVPVTNILNGITNGFIWTIIGAALYGLACFAFRSESLPPMPAAPNLKSPLPEPNPVDPRVNKIPPAMTVRKRIMLRRKPRLEYEIETIEGIGPVRGTLLRNMGIKTSEDLLHGSTTKRGRHRIAREAGVSDAMLLTWIYRADLLRVRGVGRQYSGLLESAGVNTVTNLSTRSPKLLHQTLKIVNREKNLVRRVPPVRTIQMWVNDARNLECIVE